MKEVKIVKAFIGRTDLEAALLTVFVEGMG